MHNPKATTYNPQHWPPTDQLPVELRGLDPHLPTTADAVAVWQAAHGLKADGMFGPASLEVARASSWVLGVDVSAWQKKPIDWAKARKAGIRFAFIKATQNEGYSSKLFADQCSGALAAGLEVAPYHYAVPEIGDSPKAEAMRLLDAFKWHKFTLLPVLDFEEAWQGKRRPDGTPDPAYKVDGVFLAEWAAEFVAYVEQKAGFLPIFYSYVAFIAERRKAFAAHPILARCPLWAAKYDTDPPKNVAPWTSWQVWQFTQKGGVPGFSGHVDLNRATSASLETIRITRQQKGAGT